MMKNILNPNKYARFGEILANGLSVGLVAVDKDCRIICWNHWMEKHSSILENDIIGKNIFEKFPDILERDKAKYITDCVENKTSFLLSPLLHHYLISLSIIKNDREVRMFQNVRIYPFFEDDENFGAIIIIKDLTEQILYEKEINRLTRILKSIRSINKLMIRAESENEMFDNACNILVKDIGYKFCWVGLIQKENFDVIPAALAGIESELFAEVKITWDDSVYGQGIIGSAIKTGHVQVSEQIQGNLQFKPWWEFARKIGYQSVCALPLKIEGSVIGTLNIHSEQANIFHGEELELLQNIANDISFAIRTLRDRKKQREAEERLLHSQKMEAIGTLAGGIAHDFNNILGIITGYAELMRGFEISEDDPMYGNLDEILKASYRAKELVDQILTFCRKTEDEKYPLTLSSIIKEGIKFLRSSLPATIEIQHHIEDNLPPVMANPSHIHQIIMNLCTNAFHAMKNKGVLEIRLDQMKIDEHWARQTLNLEPGIYNRLWVKDTGYGMEPEIIKRIFDPYFTTKGIGEGTGLGLSIVMGIIENLKGAVTVSSELGKGSLFQVFLPVFVENTIEYEDNDDSKPLRTGKERILFIDDEVSILNVGRRILERLSYEVVSCSTSIMGLEVFCSHPEQFDLVITDYTMPQMTGVELFHKIKSIRPDIPVILCTGYNDSISPEQAKGIGIQGYLSKPIRTSELSEAVRNALDKI